MIKQLKSFWYLLDDIYKFPKLNMAKYDLMKRFDPDDFRKEKGVTFLYHDCNGLTISCVELYTDEAGHWHFSKPRKL